MKRLLCKLVIVVAIASSFSASANWTASVGYADFQTRGLNLVYGSVGHQFNYENFTFMPEIRIGFGASKADTIEGGGIIEIVYDLEVETFTSASVRAQYNFNDSFGIFLQPSYSRIKQNAIVNDVNLSDTSTEFDVGIGAAYSFTENISVEVRVESVSSYDIASIGLRYSF